MNLIDKNGCKFRAIIDGSECEGVIYVENEEVYLLQDKKYGSKPCHFPSELGYECSWTVEQGTVVDLENNDVKAFRIIEDISRKDNPENTLSSNCESSNCEKRKLLLFIL